MINTRPAFFGKLMPKEPRDDIIIDQYHETNKAYDIYPDKLDDIVDIKDKTAICKNGTKLPIPNE